MLRSVAVQRINDELGFRPDGHSLEVKILMRMQEAQRDLEHGKTLPKFLRQENQTLVLPAGEHEVAKPTGFLRDEDENPLHFFAENSDKPFYLARRFYRDAVVSNLREQDQARSPSVYVLRKDTIDFIVVADRDYEFVWDYYKADVVLTQNIENLWLKHASDWLIGETGRRIARALRDAAAVASFDALTQSGRAMVFGDLLVDELSGGPLQMGANL